MRRFFIFLIRSYFSYLDFYRAKIMPYECKGRSAFSLAFGQIFAVKKVEQAIAKRGKQHDEHNHIRNYSIIFNR